MILKPAAVIYETGLQFYMNNGQWKAMSDLASLLQFVREVANSLLDSWEPIVKQRRHMEFSKQQREWQMLRRGR